MSDQTIVILSFLISYGVIVGYAAHLLVRHRRAGD